MAYSQYRAAYGDSQSIERLAERGGFSATEMDDHFPGWRAYESKLDAYAHEIVRIRWEARKHLKRCDCPPNQESGEPCRACAILDDVVHENALHSPELDAALAEVEKNS